jgi:16S rRNA (cytidine1402-2'-O)-methyltransferase
MTTPPVADKVEVMSKPAQSAARSYFLADRELEVRPLAAGLYLVATPIGNLGDVTLRALETLAGADLIACEDTRVTGKLTERYGISTHLTPYHEHNAATARPKVLERLAGGAAIALVSDAGTPLISDPGYKLVRAAQAEGYPVTAIPGASSVLAALSVAGLPTDRFFFEGFLPAKQAARRERITALARLPATQVLFESGPRLAASLADLAGTIGDREAAICRELTKLHEEVRRDTLANLAAHYAQGGETRGEFVVVIAPPDENAQAVSAQDIDDMLRKTLEKISLKDAVASVADATGQPRKEIYRRALELVKTDDKAR